MKVLLLLGIALFFSLHQVSIKKGTISCDTTTGTFVSIATTAILFTALSLPSLNPLSDLQPAFVAAMIIAGVLHFLVARTAFYVCIDRVGANVAATLATTRVFFAAMLGLLLLAEHITARVVLMAGLIFAGVFALSRPGGVKDARGILLGLFTGFVAALSSVVVRTGMEISSNAVLGTAIGYISALLLFPIVAGKKIEINSIGRDYWPFILGGIFVGFGHYMRYVALSLYPVSVVESFLSTYPLFTVILSWIFIRDVEVFSLRFFIAAILIISGVEAYFLL
ncbi:DMT family transporter [Archaeoglobus veneficus]|uniref:EamA domain-containing protein n=1 Tax=Archaeoglobus veneficus (strain DSM 11195 / SNP6) TaxID=693661 RepID=F2KT62_ARCVS|nr:DMT family transporter [Archaeoglobus veneficus]AEA47092.1 protein of unknown function DUF6 transmembrane [Archaeoglobus veneficus SNP6]